MSKISRNLELKPFRGTCLFKTTKDPLIIHFNQLSTYDLTDWKEIWMIRSSELQPIKKLNPEIPYSGEIEIPPHTPFMVINLLHRDIKMKIIGDPSSVVKIYDPYLYEHTKHQLVDPAMIQESFDIPSNYQDILAKWYSCKFSYDDYNLIFLRPQLGISFQTHQKRSEHWEILKGNPIIVEGNNVHYEVKEGDQFDISRETLHTIINPSENAWVLLKETYAGEFDEEDIVRLFNPNHYNTE